MGRQLRGSNIWYTMSNILGLDPGKKGAITFIDPIDHVFWIHDMPIRQVGTSERRWELDYPYFSNMLDRYDPLFGSVEDVWSMTGDGNVGAFSFGAVFGSVMGILHYYGCRTTRVRPALWKANMRVTASKESSIARAIQLVPEAAQVLDRKKDDGRAESLLIAMYAAFAQEVTFEKPLTFGGLNGADTIEPQQSAVGNVRATTHHTL